MDYKKINYTCNRCDNQVYQSDVPEYFAVCPDCDENMDLVELTAMTDIKPPKYVHNCPHCIYLDSETIGACHYDYYVCRSNHPKNDCYIARYSNEPSHYAANPVQAHELKEDNLLESPTHKAYRLDKNKRQ